jgi:hypothetical protein
MVLILSGCKETPLNTHLEVGKNSIGEYKNYGTQTFAGVVNGGTYRNATGNVFPKSKRNASSIIEVYPGDTYEPDLPKSLKANYYAEVLLEEVNRHAEKPKVIFSTKTTNLEKAKVKIPNEPGKFYRYTITIRDEKNQFKDVRYDPLYTTYENYNMAIRMIKPSYKENEKITFAVTNWGPNYISVSENFTIQKKIRGKWKTIEPNIPDNLPETLEGIIPSAWNMNYLAIDSDSHLLPDKAIQTMELKYHDLDEGEYKLIIKMGSSRHEYQLEDSFKVQK